MRYVSPSPAQKTDYAVDF